MDVDSLISIFFLLIYSIIAVVMIMISAIVLDYHGKIDKLYKWLDNKIVGIVILFLALIPVFYYLIVNV